MAVAKFVGMGRGGSWMDCNLLALKTTSLQNTCIRRQVRGLAIAMRLTEPKKVCVCVVRMHCTCLPIMYSMSLWR